MNTNINTNYVDFSGIFDSILDTQPIANMDPFEQYLNLSLATSPTPAINPPFFDFDQWCQSQPTTCAQLSDTLNKTTEGTQALFQDKPNLSAVFSNLVQTDPYNMTMPLSLTQGLLPASITSQALKPPSASELLSTPSFSSSSIYEDALSLTWPTSEVSFKDFDMKDLSFLDTPFTLTTAVATTKTATAPRIDIQLQSNLLLPSNSDSHTANNSSNNVTDGLGYSIAPPPVTTVTSAVIPNTPAHILSYFNPCPQAPPLPQPVQAPPSSNYSVNTFRTMANASDLALPQIDTFPTVPHLSETAPGTLPLLWSTFPSVQLVPPLSQALLPHPDPAMVLPAVVPQSTPAQDAIICQSYSPTAFVLDGSNIAKKLASRRQSASVTIFQRTSPPIGSANVVHLSSPYTRNRYPQPPKKRRTSGLGGADDEYGERGFNDSNGANCLKMQKTAELDGATTSTPMYINDFDTSQRQNYHSTPSLPQSPPTATSTAAATALKGYNSRLKRKSGRKPTLKKITDCAHYRPRNAFFMFRGFVSHIHTYIHAKQLSSSFSSDVSSASFSCTSSSCSMTSIASTTTTVATRPDSDNSHRNSSDRSDDIDATLTSSSPYFDFPTPYSDIQQRQQGLHLSLHLPPTTSIQSQNTSPTEATTTEITAATRTTTTTLSPHPSRRRTRQAQTKVSVSCGKIWSSPCLPTCSSRSTGCANCRMRSLFRQASDYLKLRQTEIERLIEFPLLSHGHELSEEEGGRGMMMRLEDSFNWREFEMLYPESDLFKWHREYLTVHDNENGDNEGLVLDVEEMKAIWMENELAYEKAFSEGARKRITQEGMKATTGVAYSSCSNKRIAPPITHKE
ncbi:MAG: hypothetical protein JOS17DRAFT_790355 [Linnemannia elongata]|nr:MAG: hypothetical protein JOS17DRAFT_790355 [Linnemannia elongata]